MEICVEEAAGRVPVIAGAGSNSTDEAIALTRHAKEVGCRRGAVGDRLLQQADAGRHVSPFHGHRRGGGHPDPALQHSRPRAIVEITRGDDGAAGQAPNIIGVKDATANLMRPVARAQRLRQGLAADLGRRRHRAGLYGPWRPWLHLGDRQCRAQALRRVPDRLPARATIARARELQDRLMPLHDAMFCEPSPAPVKYGASLLGHCTPDVRLPLVEATEARARGSKTRWPRRVGHLISALQEGRRCHGQERKTTASRSSPTTARRDTPMRSKRRWKPASC